METIKQTVSESKPWLKYYNRDIFNVRMPEGSLYDAIRNNNQDNLDGNAINYYGQLFSYRDLFNKIDHYAKCFVARGLHKGDCISFLTLAFPESVFAFYALNKIGVTVNLIDPRMDVKRIRDSILISESKMLFMLNIVYPKVKNILAELNLELTIVHTPTDSFNLVKRTAYNFKNHPPKVAFDKKTISCSDFVKTPFSGNVETCSDKDLVAAITQTGGTTGSPKSVMLSNYSINTVAQNVALAYSDWEYDLKGKKWLDIIPIFTSYGLVCGVQVPLVTKEEMIIYPNFKPQLFPELIARYKPNNTIAVPAYYEMLTADERFKNMDMSFILQYVSGGDTMTEAFEKKINDFLFAHGCTKKIVQGYGMSELSSLATFSYKGNCKPESVGIPSFSTTVGIFRPDSFEELAIGEVGEVCVCGPTLMKGYLNNPEETENVLKVHNDGKVWMHSGDYGYIDEDGFLFIRGRIKRMITRFDGHKIFPVQIESLVSSHPDVVSCCVVSINDKNHGQGHLPLVLSMINKKKDAKKVRAELKKLCDEKLEERGKPCDVLILDELPLTSFGKIDLNSLTKEYEDYDYR